MLENSFIPWLSTNYIELIAAIAGILGVWLTTRQLIWCWPVALVNVILYIYIFFKSRLYADFGLQIFYFVLTLYGWYNWLYGGKEHKELKVSKISMKVLGICLLIGIPASFITGYLLSRYTNAALPYIDSLVAVWGIIGTWMMAKKLLENWLLWIIVDLVCVGIYMVKNLYPTSVLYFIFTVLAVYGYLQWKRTLQVIEVK
jgi:nicotinamide mononucleotide transporter